MAYGRLHTSLGRETVVPPRSEHRGKVEALMSELQLTPELIEDLVNVIAARDPDGRKPGTAVQYLAAAIGVMIASQRLGAGEKQELLDHLCVFAQHVLNDVERHQRTPPKEQWFGIWKPESGS